MVCNYCKGIHLELMEEPGKDMFEGGWYDQEGFHFEGNVTVKNDTHECLLAEIGFYYFFFVELV